MKVILPDGKELELPEGASGLDAARAIGPKLAEQAVLVRLDGRAQDLRAPLADGGAIQILTTRNHADPDALAVLRHSTAHLLAEAARRLYPGTKVAIGPPIDDGFYYDFEFPEPISDDALGALEEEIRREIAEGRTFERSAIDRDEARRLFQDDGEPYKVELVDSADGEISLYRQGDFTDLCRGPHLQDASPIKAVKLLSVAGAYWRGDSNREQLTRIYGTAFYRQEDLDAHLHRLEEARRRDHRRVGRELRLFEFSELAPGMPFWQPRGMVIWNVLEDLRRRENARRGYHEVRTPQLYDAELWRTSGHWEKYAEHMFTVDVEGRPFALKPMNCPGHCVVYRMLPRSYRDLPFRVAEAGNLHRNELSGVLHGLLRVRHFVQDDAHIFCTLDQAEDEVLGCLEYGFFLYDLFGFDMRVELSTRPGNRLGTDDEWDRAEAALDRALRRQGIGFQVNAGDGAFYGPKIDLHMVDALGRGWQLGTVQLDFQLPQRFDLAYQGADNAEHQPVMIHRALLGSLERFIGILLEHTGGELPIWLAPVQARVVPVADRHQAGAGALRDELAARGVRTEMDVSEDTVGKRIRAAELDRVPFAVVFGDREAEGATLSLRSRGTDGLTELDRSAALATIEEAATLGSLKAGATGSSPSGPSA
jgi:threonyl-tRNA synthetase